MANLSIKQQNLLSKATPEQLELWMAELSTGITWSHIQGLYEEVNRERLRRDDLKV